MIQNLSILEKQLEDNFYFSLTNKGEPILYFINQKLKEKQYELHIGF